MKTLPLLPGNYPERHAEEPEVWQSGSQKKKAFFVTDISRELRLQRNMFCGLLVT